MKERLSHKTSTLIGVGIAVIALALVAMGKATLTEVSISVPVILYAVWYKGKKQETKE